MQDLVKARGTQVRQVNKRTIWQSYKQVYASEHSEKLRSVVDKLHRERPTERLKVSTAR